MLLKLKMAIVAIGILFTDLLIAQTQVKLLLRDGSSFSGTTNLNSVSLNTAFGKLDVPIKNISTIDIGVIADPSLKGRVETSIKQLANSNESMRKSAYDELINLDISSIPLIQDFISSEKYEPSIQTDYTADQALSSLLSQYNLKDNYSDKDIVTIDYQYTMGGVYDFKKMEVKTDYGSLSIAKSKIERIEILYTNTGDGSDKVFKLMGNKHISGNTSGGWLNTGIMVRAGQKLSINSAGEITLASLSNSKYKPDGSIAGTAATNYDDYGYDTGAKSTYPTYGNVVYKIGDAGVMAKAGASFNGSAASSGILFLSVYETVFNPANSGSYTVKISLK